MKSKDIKPSTDLVFSLKAREMCKSCKRYGKKATCPPYIDTMEYYQNLLPMYTYGVLYYERFAVVGEDYKTLSRSSSMGMHEHIMSELARLRGKGCYFMLGLGAGSCKLCKQCEFPCPIPSKSLVPIEATGIDVVETMKRQGVTLTFPVKDYFYRVAAVFYDWRGHATR